MGTTRVGRVTAGGLLAAAVLLAGCSAADSTDDGAADDPGTAETRGDDVGAAQEPPGEVATGGEDAGDGAVPGVAVGGDTAGRDVVREAHLTLSSDDPTATVDAIGRAAEQAGGFVSGTDLQRDGDHLAGTVTIRVPADRLSGTLERVVAAGVEVIDRQLSSTDVTTEVSDVAAQLRNLRALEAQLVELLAEAREAGGTEDVLTVFDRVRTVRDEIERLDGRRATLADLVSLATVTVRVVPTAALAATATVVPEPAPWDPGGNVRTAWDATLAAGRGTVDVVIVLLVTVLPMLLLWGLPAAAVVWLVRRWRGGATPSRYPVPATVGAPPPTSGGSVPSTSDRDRD